ncbi:hypothetical protein K461DRAFT_295320 [Myriangium duriaei CBS 260.36]|uniref:Mitochondrial import inner membrane translocase subunit TIM54 n=1 Tax=Myriangium duriaei CBS 260.36 TaxID=1168546 RepID=A0A9P4J2K6_9PEZI|nr:hypothetical protein K461DRAFT_295320 [Myriangium duriaei CBS 260.36]
MSETPGSSSTTPASSTNAVPNASNTTAAAAAKSEGNPALRMLGLPKWRPRLPSRNWLIFLSVTGSFTAAVLYDRHQKRRIQRKWADTVSHLASDPLPTNTMPRRVRIYVQAPPGDGMMPAREEFYEYVKPVLVAGALDWEVVEGRREGDVRWAVAEGVRRKRRRQEGGGGEVEMDVVAMARERGGTREWEGIAGDLVMGRHAWKEYVRGLHEGWLGPLEKPAETEVEVVRVEEEKGPDGSGHTAIGDVAVETLKDVVENVVEEKELTEEEKTKKEEEEKRKKLFKPEAYLAVRDYASASLPASMPEYLGPTTVLPFPHILGFLNSPTRIWRFLHKRRLADEIGRQTAAFVLATSYRPFDAQTETAAAGQPSDSPASEFSESPVDTYREPRVYEQQALLANEEPEWHKSVRKRERVEGKEDLWRDPIVLDERIASKMRVFELTQEDEQRAAAFLEKPKEESSDKEQGDS